MISHMTSLKMSDEIFLFRVTVNVEPWLFETKTDRNMSVFPLATGVAHEN